MLFNHAPLSYFYLYVPRLLYYEYGILAISLFDNNSKSSWPNTVCVFAGAVMGVRMGVFLT